MPTTSAERKGQNEVTFRSANEDLERGARDLVDGDGSSLVPFLCECPRPKCTRVVLLTMDEYEHVRAHARRGIAVHGHEDPEVEHLISENDRFIVTEKFGEAAEVVEQQNPRQ